jgi:hypothetical protein
LRLANGTNRAPGIPAASRLPWSNATRASSRACMTNVGTDTWGSNAEGAVARRADGGGGRLGGHDRIDLDFFSPEATPTPEACCLIEEWGRLHHFRRRNRPAVDKARKSGSQLTHRWRNRDSNPRSRCEGVGLSHDAVRFKSGSGSEMSAGLAARTNDRSHGAAMRGGHQHSEKAYLVRRTCSPV